MKPRSSTSWLATAARHSFRYDRRRAVVSAPAGSTTRSSIPCAASPTFLLQRSAIDRLARNHDGGIMDHHNARGQWRDRDVTVPDHGDVTVELARLRNF